MLIGGATMVLMRQVSPAMVGRDAELRELRRIVAGAAGGVPGLVVLRGDAGIGKTRLVEAVVSEHRGTCLVLRGPCSLGAAQAMPLAPIAAALRDLRRGLGAEEFLRLSTPHTAVLEQLVPEAGVSQVAAPRTETSEAQVYAAVADVLLRAARPRTVLLVVEDAHWMDASSQQLLDYVLRSVRTERLAVMVSFRSDDPAFGQRSGFVADLSGLPHAVSVVVPRLSDAEVGEQVAQISGEGMDAGHLARVVEVSGGVPLLVEEVVSLGLDDLGGAGDVADRLLGHRLSGLTESARCVVDTAALSMREPTADELASACRLPADEADRGLAAAVAHGVLVRRAGTVTFRHPLLREAALARLMPHASRGMHRRWARVVAERPPGLDRAVEQAHHLAEAHEWGPALERCLEAADLAEGLSAYPERRQLLCQAAAIWHHVQDAPARTGTDLAEILGEAAEAAHLTSGRVAETQRLVDAARAALPADAPPFRKAMLDLLWDWAQWGGDDHLTTEEVMAAASLVTEEVAAHPRILACLAAADALLKDADPAAAEPWAREAVSVAERAGETLLGVRARCMLARVQSSLGNDRSAVVTAETAVRQARRSNDLFVIADSLSVLAWVQWTAGDPEDLTTIARAVEWLGGDRPGPLPAYWGMACANLAEGLLDVGRWEEASEVLERASSIELPTHVFWSVRRLADHLDVWRGGGPTRTSDMPPEPRRGGLAERGLGDLLASSYTYGEAASYRGDVDEVRCQVRPVLIEDEMTTNPGYLLPLLEMTARSEADARSLDPENGDGAWTIGRVEHLVELLRPRNARDAAYVAHVRAEVARWRGSDSAAAWATVVDRWRQVARPQLLARALVRWGVTLSEDGRRTEARRALREAIEIGERLEATPLVDHALAAARRANLRLTSSTPRLVADLGLTDRELDVLRLIATGASNAAIAETLSISPKTVSVHVSHILAKLGVTSRGAAAAKAHLAALTHEQSLFGLPDRG